jgi:zinc protease
MPRNMRSFFMLLILVLIGFSLTASISQAMQPVQRTVLSNKLVLLSGEEHSIPLVTIQVLIEAGSRMDPAGKEGLANLTANGLVLGTSKHSISEINDELDFMGASLHASCGMDFMTLTLRVLKKDLDKGLDLLMEVLTQPSFPDKELKKEAENTIAGIQSDEDNPMSVAGKTFRKTLFLNSPYAHPVEGTKESVSAVTRDSVMKHYQAYYHPNNAILSVAGDITGEEIQNKLVPRLSKWPAVEVPKKEFMSVFAKGQETVKISRNITQANIIIGHSGVSRGNPDFYALSVMNYILGGGGFASRLLEEIRNKRGLAYSVSSFFEPDKYPGSFQIVLQTKNTSAKEAVSLALQQMERMQKEQVSDKELDSAKKYLIGSFPMRLDTQSKLVNFLTQVEYYGIGIDYPEKYPTLIGSVTKEDILRVAGKYLHPKEYALVIVANLKEAGFDQ